MKTPGCAILVLSCDKYADSWSPFFSFFFKYWPDCPFPVYLGNNFKIFEHPKVIQVFSGCNKSWTEELEIILNQLPYEYLLIILEDYFIYEKVNTYEIIEILNIMQERNAAFTRLAAFPTKYNVLWEYEKIKEHPHIGEIKTGSKYRVCLQTAIWKKDILMRLLNDKENPWQFETEASKRSEQIPNPFLCVVEDKTKSYVHGPITYYCTAITKGVWMREAIDLCKREGIEINTKYRPVETKRQEIIRKTYNSLPRTIKRVIEFLKVRLMFNN